MNVAKHRKVQSVEPHSNVRVGFDIDYGTACAAFGGGDDRSIMAAWRALGDLLAGRSGWHFDVVNLGFQPEVLWSLGTFGASLLNIQVDQESRFVCFDYEEDRTDCCSDIAAVEKWLANREERAKQPNTAQIELAQHDDWRGLKIHRYTVIVSWSDGYYAAAIRGAMLDATFGETLQQAVNRTGEMICNMYGAPAELASELNLTVELERSAADRIRKSGK